MVDTIRQQLAEWHDTTADLRSDSTARKLVDLLPVSPVLTAAHAAGLLSVSERAARAALVELSRRGILQPLDVDTVRPGRPRQWWQANALLDATVTWVRNA